MGAPTVTETQEPAKTKGKPVKFAVYQYETGRYTLGEHRFVPGVVTEIPASLSLNDEEIPVKVFDSREAADAANKKLQANFLAKKSKV